MASDDSDKPLITRDNHLEQEKQSVLSRFLTALSTRYQSLTGTCRCFDGHTNNNDNLSETDRVLGDEKVHKERPLIGQLLGLMSAISWVIGGTCVQMLQGALPAFELNCWRFGGLVPILMVWIFCRKSTLLYPVSTIIPLLGLSLIISTVNYGFFASLEFIAVGDSESLNAAIYLIFAAIGSSLLLREKIDAIKIMSIIISIVGVFCITQPDFLFQGKSLGSFDTKDQMNIPVSCAQNISENNIGTNSSTDNGSNSTSDIIPSRSSRHEFIGYILVSISGFCSAATVLMIRGTKVKEVTSDVQVIYGHLFGFFISAFLMGVLEKPTLPSDALGMLYLVGHVIFSFSGTVCFYVALNMASGVLVALSYTTSIVFSMVAQYFILQDIQPGHRNLLEICGALLVLISACMNPVHQLVIEKRRKYQELPEEMTVISE